MRSQTALALVLIVSAAHCGFPVLDEYGFGVQSSGVPCATDENCDDQNPCTTNVCSLATRTCEYAQQPDGPAPASAQTPEDCKSFVCSAGEPSTVDDLQDFKNDDNPCTIDMCTNGTPTNDASADGTNCMVATMAGTCMSGTCIIP